MPLEIKVPAMGESVSEVTIDKWLLAEGQAVAVDAPIAVLESDKATVELPSQSAGVITKLLKKPGDTAQVGEVIAILEPGATGTPPKATPQEPPATTRSTKPAPPTRKSEPPPRVAERLTPPPPQPSAARESAPAPKPVPQPSPPSHPTPPITVSPGENGNGREEEVVRMTRLRRTLARRLVEAQQNAAILTTFNEIDLSAVMDLRKQYAEEFQKRYATKLGFMSFFVKASIDALNLVPQVNAEIRGDDIVFKNYYDIAVAVGGGKGLVVPVLRNADRMSFAEIELAIADFGRRAKENQLKPEELQGGTFTITNGGIYGSLLSTPIINPPQSGILGMHAIQERPVARNGQVVIRPMMYVALSYDHRLVDGREAVTFLKRIKDGIESPARMLLEV